jgi:ribosomal protein L21
VADIVGQLKGPKINGFKFKPKKHYSRSWGHRQLITKIRVKEIATA